MANNIVERFNRQLALITEMNAIGKLSCMAFVTFINAITENDYFTHTDDQLDAYYNFGHFDLCNDLSQQQTEQFLLSAYHHQPRFSDLLNDKSCLFTIIARPNATKQIKEQLVTLGEDMIAQDATGNWSMRLIEQETIHEYVLLNLFLTNNEEPQIVNLGHDVADYLQDTQSFNMAPLDISFNSSENGLKTKPHFIRDLNETFYYWQPVKPSNLWQKQIVSNLAQTDLVKAQKAINHNFMIFKDLTCHKTRKLENAHTIEILDLLHFYHFLNKTKTSKLLIKNKNEFLAQIKQKLK